MNSCIIWQKWKIHYKYSTPPPNNNNNYNKMRPYLIITITLLIVSVLLCLESAKSSRPLLHDHGNTLKDKDTFVHSVLRRGPVPPSGQSNCTNIPGSSAGQCPPPITGGGGGTAAYPNSAVTSSWGGHWTKIIFFKIYGFTKFLFSSHIICCFRFLIIS